MQLGVRLFSSGYNLKIFKERDNHCTYRALENMQKGNVSKKVILLNLSMVDQQVYSIYTNLTTHFS